MKEPPAKPLQLKSPPSSLSTPDIPTSVSHIIAICPVVAMSIGSGPAARRFFVLDEALSVADLDVSTLIGRVVTDPRRPDLSLSSACGDSDPFSLSDIVPGIHPRPTEFSQVNLELTGGSISGMSGGVGSLLDVAFSATQSQTLRLSSQCVRRYALGGLDARKTRRYFDLLMADEGYARRVRRAIRESGGKEVYFVVGVLTTEKSSWTRVETAGREVSLTAGVPVAAAAAGMVPPAVDLGTIGGGPVLAKSHGVVASWQVEEEQVFALAYDIVKKVKVFDSGARMGIGSAVVDKGALKARADYLAMSGRDGESDDGESEVEDEDGSEHAIVNGGALGELSGE
ncbi:hypothetical protein B0H63DRAFT_474162 [Podospora didyma]|uniref:Uncharacterized protein n=1 Tax=Podospora didyma TaxID=330526 RepID=A0AAE0U043_9PEZI|nr:hypothetical protein B0H63DRAFT_474162 [Podospora didyma]